MKPTCELRWFDKKTWRNAAKTIPGRERVLQQKWVGPKAINIKEGHTKAEILALLFEADEEWRDVPVEEE
jgi:hypothetical protein